MGSGRGRTRRAQTTAYQRLTDDEFSEACGQIVVNENKWHEFVKQTDTQKTSVRDYYCAGTDAEEDIAYLDTVDSASAADAELEHILNNFLADAVTTGALTLPGGFNTDDFIVHADAGEVCLWNRRSGHTTIPEPLGDLSSFRRKLLWSEILVPELAQDLQLLRDLIVDTL